MTGCREPGDDASPDFRAPSGFFGLIRHQLFNRRDGDGGNERHVAVNFGVAFGEGANCGQVVFLELVGQVGEPPAEHHDISGGEREREFLRWLVLVALGIRVWFQCVFD